MMIRQRQRTHSAMDNVFVVPDIGTICAASALEGPDEFDESERALRDLVKTQIPRLLRHDAGALLVEEMEVCSGRARVDLAVIGDHLIGIELKGPKDDVTRLPRQVEAYSRCFDRVVLVVHETLLEKAKPLVPDWWGLVVSIHEGGKLTHRFEQRPKQNPNLDMDALLSLLWREEIDSMLTDLLGSVPKPRSTKKTLRAELISRIEPPALRFAGLRKLRERADWRTVPVHQ